MVAIRRCVCVLAIDQVLLRLHQERLSQSAGYDAGHSTPQVVTENSFVAGHRGFVIRHWNLSVTVHG